MKWRHATHDDLELLANLNRQLIVDEGHHNRMGLPELQQRMRAWLEGEYRAVLFLRDHIVVAYALFRTDEWNRTHIRQFLVIPAARRQGVGRDAMRILRSSVAPADTPIILEVLTATRPRVRSTLHAVSANTRLPSFPNRTHQLELRPHR